MKRTIILASVLALAACNDSKEPTQDQASPPVSQAAAPAPTIATTTPPASATEEAEVPKAAAAQTLDCEFNNDMKFQVTLTGMVEQTNPRGGSETYGKYRTKGDAIGLVPEKGDAAIRGGVYVLNDELFLEPTENGKFIVSETEGGDMIGCKL